MIEERSMATALVGVDPAVLRELSGIYRPFSRAVRELVSNSYDADAQHVEVRLSGGFDRLEVVDDGSGLTPVEVRSEYLKVGGSRARLDPGLTPGGRRRVGSKGIGFLAVARYCDQLELETVAKSQLSLTSQIHSSQDWMTLPGLAAVPLDEKSLDHAVTGLSVRNRNGRLLEPGIAYEVGPGGQLRTMVDSSTTLNVEYAVDWSKLRTKVFIDFRYLLSLIDKEDLTKIRDFAHVEVEPLDRDIGHGYTRVSLMGLKPFVRRELAARARPSRVQSIGARSGVNRFCWDLSRTTPIEYEYSSASKSLVSLSGLDYPEMKCLGSLSVTVGESGSTELTRPIIDVASMELDGVDKDLYYKVNIDEPGLRAVGFLVGKQSLIYPPELRGIAIRISGVQVGNPSFLGIDAQLSGERKAALAQISGEVNVLAGFDAIDSINPGREGFYDESADFQVLKRVLVGDGESLGGAVGTLVNNILLRSSVTGWAKKTLDDAKARRHALIDFAKTANYQLIARFKRVPALAEVADKLASKRNGLLSAVRWDDHLPRNIRDLEVALEDGIQGEFLINFADRKLVFNKKLDVWDWDIPLLGERIEVQPKHGAADGPVCEFDPSSMVMAVNWSHQARRHLGDAMFLKLALSTHLAASLGAGDIDETVRWSLTLSSPTSR